MVLCPAYSRGRAGGMEGDEESLGLENRGHLEPAVERDDDAHERGVGLARPAVGAQHILMRKNVVGQDEAAGIDELPDELEVPLVLLLRRVEEDDVEDVLDV